MAKNGGHLLNANIEKAIILKKKKHMPLGTMTGQLYAELICTILIV